MSGTTKKSKPKRQLVSQDDCIAWAVGKGFTIERDGDWCWLTHDINSDGSGFSDKQEIELRDYGFRKRSSGPRKLRSGSRGFWGHSCMAPTRLKRFTKGKSKPAPAVTTATTEEGESLIDKLKRQLQEAKA